MPGNYTVCLTVTDAAGHSSQGNKIVSVRSGETAGEDEPPDENEKTKSGIGMVYVWAGLGVLVLLTAVAVVAAYVVKARKRKVEDDGEELADTSEGDELGRVNAEGGNE